MINTTHAHSLKSFAKQATEKARNDTCTRLRTTQIPNTIATIAKYFMASAKANDFIVHFKNCTFKFSNKKSTTIVEIQNFY